MSSSETETKRIHDLVAGYLAGSGSAEPHLTGLLARVDREDLIELLRAEPRDAEARELREDLEAFLLDELPLHPEQVELAALLEAPANEDLPGDLLARAQGMSHLVAACGSPGTPEAPRLVYRGGFGIGDFLGRWKLPLVGLGSLGLVLAVGWQNLGAHLGPGRFLRRSSHRDSARAPDRTVSPEFKRDRELYSEFWGADNNNDYGKARALLEKLLLRGQPARVEGESPEFQRLTDETPYQDIARHLLSRYLREGLGGSIQPRRALLLSRAAAESDDEDWIREYAILVARGARRFAWVEEIRTVEEADGSSRVEVVTTGEGSLEDHPFPETLEGKLTREAWLRTSWKTCLESGRGSEEDLAESLRWYRRAAGLGDHSAMNSVGWLLEKGPAAIRDPEQAAFWFRLAGRHGWGKSDLDTLGSSGFRGIGVSHDPTMAAQLFTEDLVTGACEGEEDHEAGP